MKNRRAVAIALSILIVLGVASTVTLAHRSQTPAYLDSSLPVSQRVDDLLGRMTLQEKIGQVTLISVSRLWGDCNGSGGSLNGGCMQAVLGDDHVGAILSGGGEAPQPNTPASWAQLTNSIQHFAVDSTPLHIPVLYGTDAVHGDNNLLGAVIYPHNLGMAASWDPTLERRIAAATAGNVLATGVHWTYAPVSDVARDPRWGRYYETFGEDPTLAASMVASAVHGFQSVAGIAATAKHYVGYSGAVRGHDRTAADLSLRTLQLVYLPTFRSAVDAGVDTVMVDSGSVNGVPDHASHYLLTDVLRGQLGFKGVVVSDWQDIESLYDAYHLASSYEDAIRLSIMAGVDMSMVPYDAATYSRDLADLVASGQVPQSRIDESVRHILTLKFSLGLFDHPYVDASGADPGGTAAQRALARTAADESMTLLKNDGVLPLKPSVRSILVAGPAATSLPDQMGGWTVGWQGVPSGITVPGVTILNGIQQAAAHAKVTYLSGSNLRQVVAAARKAGVVILVVGEPPYAEGLGDTETAALPADQERLLRAVEAAHVRTVLVTVAGRPLIMPGVPKQVSALLMAWLPGTEGGDAVADVLFGRVDPSGRLPVSWPKRIGQEPLSYQQLPGTNTGPGSLYDPLFPFGAGQGYTTFTYGGLALPSAASAGDTITLHVTVHNTGARAGDDVVQVFVHPVDASVLVPPRRLVGFARVYVPARGATTAVICVPVSRLALVPGDVNASGPPVVERGRYTFMVGTEKAELVVR